MSDGPRLIEAAFPLKQTSLDSVHEKNVRHGHISTLHIWPARRPLAACRAALIATLLPDPGSREEREALLERLAGRVVNVGKKKKMPGGRVQNLTVEETVGGILHWGREADPGLDWFRERIKEVHGGRPPRVLDPFAGGGAIPLEAMRLGCAVTASDINPVAWFILKCTLEYPHRLAGKLRPLPRFALESQEFMEGYFRGTGRLTSKQLERNLGAVQTGLFPPPEVDLAWHIRAWGWWVLQKARADLRDFYPTVDGRPTVGYLWARTVRCKNCRALVPLLKTKWLCRKDTKRVLLTVEPRGDGTGAVFGVQADVARVGGNAAQRREHDKRTGGGTMTRSGALCPCCRTIMTMEDIRLEGRAGRLGAVMTAVIVEGRQGKEYREPVDLETQAASSAQANLEAVSGHVPFGIPSESTPKAGSGASRAFSVDGYGMDQWSKLFTPRQLLALATFVRHTRAARDAMHTEGYPPEWVEAVAAYLAGAVSRIADRGSTLCTWTVGWDKIRNTFVRFALPITWDYAESVPTRDTTGGYPGAIEWIARYVGHALGAARAVTATPQTLCLSAAAGPEGGAYDLVVTDPPYYDAIPYSDLMDFFYVWLRRTLHGLTPQFDAAFREPLAPKWHHEAGDGELIDDASRFDGDAARSKAAYEDGMARAFKAIQGALKPEGHLVVVFAHKNADAWETLVSAIIRAGFVVTASWPIQTEMGNRTRALASAALSSSVWLVCRKRLETAPAGWDTQVLAEMRGRITECLRDFWDAGIRGPDFVWAATGPALQAYSKHPIVKRANEPGQLLTVPEFLREVRRIVVDFVVGRVLSHDGGEGPTGLDDVTTYYILHRHYFRLDDAPAGACILYALSCGLSDAALIDQHDLLLRTGSPSSAGEAEEGEEEEAVAEDAETEGEKGTGSRLRLKPWHKRQRPAMGYECAGRPAPLIDQVHRLMHLWKAGDVVKVDEYFESRGLASNLIFHQLLQAIVELAAPGSEERSLLESISNHVPQRKPGYEQTSFVS